MNQVSFDGISVNRLNHKKKKGNKTIFIFLLAIIFIAMFWYFISLKNDLNKAKEEQSHFRERLERINHQMVKKEKVKKDEEEKLNLTQNEILSYNEYLEDMQVKINEIEKSIKDLKKKLNE